ncbi:MAG: hypothetical protein RLZZ623_1725 [Actinomycetota bacterium]
MSSRRSGSEMSRTNRAGPTARRTANATVCALQGRGPTTRLGCERPASRVVGEHERPGSARILHPRSGGSRTTGRRPLRRRRERQISRHSPPRSASRSPTRRAPPEAHRPRSTAPLAARLASHRRGPAPQDPGAGTPTCHASTMVGQLSPTNNGSSAPGTRCTVLARRPAASRRPSSAPSSSESATTFPVSSSATQRPRKRSTSSALTP